MFVVARSRRIGAYKLGQYLGSGSFGTVRTAVQSKTGRKVLYTAAKFWHHSHAWN